jgi:hypothetical protein
MDGSLLCGCWDPEEYLQAWDSVTGWITEHNTDAALREGHD